MNAQADDPLDTIDQIRARLSFLRDTVAQEDCAGFQITKDGVAGFYFILNEIINDLFDAGEALGNQR